LSETRDEPAARAFFDKALESMAYPVKLSLRKATASIKAAEFEFAKEPNYDHNAFIKNRSGYIIIIRIKQDVDNIIIEYADNGKGMVDLGMNMIFNIVALRLRG
jgi:transposase-like protein